MTKFFATSALITATIIAAPAAANTVLLNYEGQNGEVKDDSREYDFFNLGPATNFGPQIINLNLVNDAPFDDSDAPVNVSPVEKRAGPFTQDGRADVRISSAERSEQVDQFGTVELLLQNNFPMVKYPPVAAVFNDGPMMQYINMMPQSFVPSVSQRARFATVGPNGGLTNSLATFGATGENGNIVDNRFEYDTSIAHLYGEDFDDILQRDGDSVILGFKIDVLLEDFGLFGEEGYAKQSICIFEDVEENNDFEGCEPEETVLASFFGFMEFTRGSVTPGLLGVNSNIGAAAVVPSTVPLPAPIMMLGAGLAGLGLMRRRKHV